MLALDADRIAVDQQAIDLGAGKRAEPALVSQGEWLGRASKKLFKFEVEAEVIMIHRHPAHGHAGQHLGRSGEAAEEARGVLGLERRITRQQLVRRRRPPGSP